MILSWLPRYFADAHGLDLAGVGYASLLPWLSMFALTNVAAQIADGLLARGHSVVFVRKLMQSIGFLGPAAALVAIGQVHSVPLAIALMCAALGLGSFALSGYASNHLDIAPRYAGALMGLSNTAGTLARCDRRGRDRLHPRRHGLVGAGVRDRGRSVRGGNGGLAHASPKGEILFD